MHGVAFHGLCQSSPQKRPLTGEVAFGQVPVDPAVDACRSTGLFALQERSHHITDLVMHLESLAVTKGDTKADTKVGDVPVKMVVMGEERRVKYF